MKHISSRPNVDDLTHGDWHYFQTHEICADCGCTHSVRTSGCNDVPVFNFYDRPPHYPVAMQRILYRMYKMFGGIYEHI